MGINNCTKILWTASGLTVQDLLSLYQTYPSATETSKCKIDVDVSIVMASSGKKNYRDSLIHTANFLESIAHTCGVIISVVLDGNSRPDCKRDSWNRRRNIDIAKINAFFCRQNAISLAATYETSSAIEEDKNRLRLFNDATRTLEKL